MKLFIINVYKMFNIILFIYIMKVDRGVFILKLFNVENNYIIYYYFLCCILCLIVLC